MFKFVQISGPSLDLRAFVDLIGKDKVNEIDTQRVDHVAKFANLATECFDNRWAIAYEHLYISFFYELPIQLDGHLKEYVGIKSSGEFTGMMSRGIMSGSFVDWSFFLKWCTSEDRELSVRKLGNYLFETFFRQYAFFRGYTRTTLDDKTFMLT